MNYIQQVPLADQVLNFVADLNSLHSLLQLTCDLALSHGQALSEAKKEYITIIILIHK